LGNVKFPNETLRLYFTGAGLSALTQIVTIRIFTDKSILLLDENTKTNDRTWCFWKTTIHFGTIYFKKMDSALFANETFAGI
jgi:lycopene beta-cyclase